MKFAFATDIHLMGTNPSSRIDDYTEAVFKKIGYTLNWCKENDAILLLGGDLFSTPTVTDFLKNRLKTMILEAGVRVISIVGNHDLLYYNEDYVDRTSFKALVSPGVIEYLGKGNDRVQIGDWTIQAHIFGEVFPTECSKKTIILSHTFYNYDKNEKLATQVSDVRISGASYVCFGHDHNRYEVVDNMGVKVVRPGALTRGTSHTENSVRKVAFATIDTDTEKVEYHDIPFALNFKEVFREKYVVEREHKVISFDEIQRFIDSMRNAKLDVSAYSILYSMGKTPRTVEKCSFYLQKAGLIETQV